MVLVGLLVGRFAIVAGAYPDGSQRFDRVLGRQTFMLVSMFTCLFRKTYAELTRNFRGTKKMGSLVMGSIQNKSISCYGPRMTPPASSKLPFSTVT